MLHHTDALPRYIVPVTSKTIGRRWLNRTVIGAGVTSALGDFCYETTTVILTGFLAVLGIPAAALGLIEGTADAVASFTKIVSGYIADKLGHRKTLVLLGYALTPVGRGLIAASTGWPLILVGRLVSLVREGPAWSPARRHRDPSDQPGLPWPGVWFSPRDGHSRRRRRASARRGPLGAGPKPARGPTRLGPSVWCSG